MAVLFYFGVNHVKLTFQVELDEFQFTEVRAEDFAAKVQKMKMLPLLELRGLRCHYRN